MPITIPLWLRKAINDIVNQRCSVSMCLNEHTTLEKTRSACAVVTGTVARICILTLGNFTYLLKQHSNANTSVLIIFRSASLGEGNCYDCPHGYATERRGNDRSVIVVGWSSWAFSRAFFSASHSVKRSYWYIRQTIYSTISGVRMCLLVLWSKNFQTQPSPPNLKFSIVECGFS